MTVHIGEQMIDIDGPGIVEIQVRADGSVVWINVDGVCRLRACMIGRIVVDDQRFEVDTETP